MPNKWHACPGSDTSVDVALFGDDDDDDDDDDDEHGDDEDEGR